MSMLYGFLPLCQIVNGNADHSGGKRDHLHKQGGPYTFTHGPILISCSLKHLGQALHQSVGGRGPERTARWGDYTAAVADAEGNIWFGVEYIPNLPRTVNANWGTFIAKVTP